MVMGPEVEDGRDAVVLGEHVAEEGVEVHQPRFGRRRCRERGHEWLGEAGRVEVGEVGPGDHQRRRQARGRPLLEGRSGDREVTPDLAEAAGRARQAGDRRGGVEVAADQRGPIGRGIGEDLHGVAAREPPFDDDGAPVDVHVLQDLRDGELTTSRDRPEQLPAGVEEVEIHVAVGEAQHPVVVEGEHTGLAAPTEQRRLVDAEAGEDGRVRIACSCVWGHARRRDRSWRVRRWSRPGS